MVEKLLMFKITKKRVLLAFILGLFLSPSFLLINDYFPVVYIDCVGGEGPQFGCVLGWIVNWKNLVFYEVAVFVFAYLFVILIGRVRT